jgi:hypothetical protein
MGKITVKHYLNTNLKPYTVGDEKYYKLYFLLRYQNKNTKIKSLINLETTELEFSKIILEENNLINIRMKNETTFVESIISAIEKSGLIFDFNVFSNFWNLAAYPIIEKLQGFIRWIFETKYDEDPDIYQQFNIEVYEDILKSLKLFVHENQKCITDEIFFIQLYDKKMTILIEKYLKEKKKIGIWTVKQKDRSNIKIGEAITIEYEFIEYKTIDYLINTLILDGGFEVDYLNYLSGSIGNKQKYFYNIINSFSKT